MNKPFILCIIGKSGSGKTTIAEYLDKTYGWKLIESITDRPKRTPNEKGHTFISAEEFDKLKQSDMIAFTKFGNYRYCCLKSDVKPLNVYIIDEIGYKYLKENFSDIYNIVSIFIERPLDYREATVGKERTDRDQNMFTMDMNDFDYILSNDSKVKFLLFDDLEDIMEIIIENLNSTRRKEKC